MIVKKSITYNYIKKRILEDLCKLPECDEIVAVSRGGITIAHIMAKALNKKIGYFFPDRPEYISATKDPKKIIIVEDLIAQGRTSKIIRDYFEKKDIKYYFIPFLVDKKYWDNANDIYKEIWATYLISSDWIVFPWEEFDKMPEGDRGLFRDGTDSYGVTK